MCLFVFLKFLSHKTDSGFNKTQHMGSISENLVWLDITFHLIFCVSDNSHVTTMCMWPYDSWWNIIMCMRQKVPMPCLCQKKRGESEKAGGGCQLKVKNFKLRRITEKNTLVSTTKQTAFCIYTLMNKIFLSLKWPLAKTLPLFNHIRPLQDFFGFFKTAEVQV